MSDQAAETDAAPDAKPNAKAKKGGGGGAIVAILFGVLNLGATGFLLFRDLKRPVPVVQIGGSSEHDEGGHDGGHRRKKKEGPVAQLDPFVVNLKDEGVSRYLKTSFELELDDPESLTELTEAKRAVRDDVLRYLSSLAVADTLGEEAKQKIQDGIVARLDRQLGPGRVKKLYFTEFVIQ